MEYKALTLSSLAVVLSTACLELDDPQDQHATGSSTQAIIAGDDDVDSPRPNASIRVQNCSGTLIRPDIALTSGHCIDKTGPNGESPDWETPGEWYPLYQFPDGIPVSIGARRGLFGDNDTPWERREFTLERPSGSGSLSHGSTVLVTSVDGVNLSAEGGGGSVLSHRLNAGSWEQFRIERVAGPGALAHNDQIWLRTSGGSYLSLGADGVVTARATSRLTRGRFRVVRTGGPGAVSSGDEVYLRAWNDDWLAPELVIVARRYNIPVGSDIMAVKLDRPVPREWAIPMPAVTVPPGTSFDGVGSGRWSDWFCVDDQDCRVGDLNGDGRDDAVYFTRGWSRDVRVAASTGTGFLSTALWNGNLCADGDSCELGDINGDGKDDVVVFDHDASDVYVSLSHPYASWLAPSQRWHSSFCSSADATCLVGDVNGDGYDDIVEYVKSTRSGSARGDVYVALSNGLTFLPRWKWHDSFCVGEQVCSLGDVDGDGAADLVMFARDILTGTGRGDVFVARGRRWSFGPAERWHGWFCIGAEECRVDDFDGDGLADVATFVRSSKGGSARGDVYVALSTGDAFLPSPGQRWHDWFCVENEHCETGDFDGDGRGDVITFTKNQWGGSGKGDVYVSLADGEEIDTFLNEHSYLSAGYGPVDGPTTGGGTLPSIRQVIDAWVDQYPLGGDPNQLDADYASGGDNRPGDSGGSLYYEHPITGVPRLVGVRRQVGGTYVVTLGPGSETKPDLGSWLRAAIQSAR